MRLVDLRNANFAKIEAEEEVFILRAQDVLAAKTVILWIAEYIEYPQCPDDKLREAFECALRMRKWKKKRLAD